MPNILPTSLILPDSSSFASVEIGKLFFKKLNEVSSNETFRLVVESIRVFFASLVETNGEKYQLTDFFL